MRVLAALVLLVSAILATNATGMTAARSEMLSPVTAEIAPY